MWNEYRINRFIENTKNYFLSLMIASLIVATLCIIVLITYWLYANNYIVFGVLTTTLIVFILSATLAYFE